MNIKFSNRTYDVLKQITMKYLPACGTLYFGLAEIWGLPYPAQIEGTILLICTFLGTCLGISTANYNDGLKDEGEEND